MIKSQYFDVTYASTPKSLGKLCLHLSVDLSCTLTKIQLENAISKAIEQFPILGCRYKENFWRDQWVPDRETSAERILSMRSTQEDFDKLTIRRLPEHIDAKTSWPWRVTCIGSENKTRLIISILHQVTDAAGAFSVIHALGGFLMDSSSAPQKPGEMDRGLWQVVKATRLRDLLWVLVLTPIEWLRPMVLAPFLAKTAVPCSDHSPDTEKRMFKTVKVDMNSDSVLRKTCKKSDGTINDALIAALAIVNKQTSTKGNISGIYTINLRQHLKDDTPQPTNLSVLTMLSFRRKHVGDLEHTIGLAAKETKRQKKQKIGMPFLFGILCASWLPHFFVRLFTKALAGYAVFAATRGMMVTNIGPIDKYLAPFGDLATDASLIGPYIKGLKIPVIAATGFRDKLTMQICGYENPMEQRMTEVEKLLVKTLQGPH